MFLFYLVRWKGIFYVLFLFWKKNWQEFGIWNWCFRKHWKKCHPLLGAVLNQISAGVLIRGNVVLQNAENATEQVYSCIWKVHNAPSRLLDFKFSRNSLWLTDFDLVAVCSIFSIVLRCYRSYLRELFISSSMLAFWQLKIELCTKN